MKVLVTGATGFIGSHVARLLLNKGCAVYAIIRPDSDMRRISDIASSLQILHCDLQNVDGLDAYLEAARPEVCVHFAWHMTPGQSLTGIENVHSLGASLHLALRLANLGCKKLIVAGTCFEYDTDVGYLSETSPTRPRTLYGASKLALFHVLEQFSHTSEVKLSWLRFFYLYGPSEDERRLVPSVTLSLLNNRGAQVTAGEQIRDYLHVEDAAAAVWAVIESGQTGAINVGSGKPITVRDVVMRIGALLGRQELIELGARQYKEADPMFVCANNQRLISETSWTPRFELELGLHQTIEWWRSHK